MNLCLCYIIKMPEKIPSKLTLGGKEIPFSDISSKFSSTEWGKKLKSNIRWARFKPPEIPDKEWEKVLGADVNNLEHLVLTRGLTSSFLKGCETTGEEGKGGIKEAASFSTEEQELLLLTATVHDWGEAIKGDINFYLKTTKDHTEEMHELVIMIKEILGQMFEEKDRKDIEVITNQIVGILTHTDSKLGKAFNAIERVGYIRTSIRAYNESEKRGEKLKVPLRNMACRSLPDQIRVLVDYAKIYPPVAAYIKYHKDTIDKVFTEGENPEIRASIPKFEESKERWLSYAT